MLFPLLLMLLSSCHNFVQSTIHIISNKWPIRMNKSYEQQQHAHSVTQSVFFSLLLLPLKRVFPCWFSMFGIKRSFFILLRPQNRTDENMCMVWLFQVQQLVQCFPLKPTTTTRNKKHENKQLNICRHPFSMCDDLH